MKEEWSQLPKTRAEAKVAGVKKYFTGVSCVNGHLHTRSTATSHCCACRDACVARHRAIHGPPRISKEASYRRSRNYRERHPERVREINRSWKARNSEAVSRRMAEWEKNNREKRRAIQMGRKSRKLNATPAWADRAEIERVYKTCPKGFHVDHIIPLVSPFVCGLHVPWNLQHLPASVNMAKGNRLAQHA